MPTSQRDYYNILGVSRTATQDEIKKAYRKLARQYHPDLHSGARKTEMETKFKEVNEAHEVLGDPETRKKYDRYGHRWQDAEAYEKARQQAGNDRGKQHARAGERQVGEREHRPFRCRLGRHRRHLVDHVMQVWNGIIPGEDRVRPGLERAIANLCESALRAHPERAVLQLRDGADGVPFAAAHHLEPAARRASEAAVGADIERALLVAPFGPDDFAGQAFARRVDAPQAAADGTVQCTVEGPQTAVDRLIDVLRRGPMAARVERVDVDFETPAGDLPPMSVTA